MLGTINAVTNTVMLVVNASLALALLFGVFFHNKLEEGSKDLAKRIGVSPSVDVVPSRRFLILMSLLFAMNAYMYMVSARCNLYYACSSK